MAYFSSGAAQAYANSFRQRQPYGTFKNVKSNVGQKTFGEIPFMNFQAELAMAQGALKQYGDTMNYKIAADSNEKVAELRYGDSNQDKSAAKKAALARMLSSGAGRRAGGGGGGGEKAAVMQMLAGGGDPLKHALDVTRTNSALDADDEVRRTGFNAALKQGLAGIPDAPAPPQMNGGGGQIQVGAQPSTQLQPSGGISLKSDQTREKMLQLLNGMKDNGELSQ